MRNLMNYWISFCIVKIILLSLPINCVKSCKCLNVHEQVEVVERSNDGLSLPLLSRESSVSVKEKQIEKNPFYSISI